MSCSWAATSAGRSPASTASSESAPWPVSVADRPSTSFQSTCCSTARRRPSLPLAARTASLVITQSRVRLCSMAASTTTIRAPSSIRTTLRSSTSPSTSSSFGRCSKRLMLTLPVVSTTASGSIRVTRPIGTKIRRRCCTSTTRPSTRGGWRPTRRVATASRTRPSWSPLGSNTPRPASLATKTRVAVLTPQSLVGGGPENPDCQDGRVSRSRAACRVAGAAAGPRRRAAGGGGGRGVGVRADHGRHRGPGAGHRVLAQRPRRRQHRTARRRAAPGRVRRPGPAGLDGGGAGRGRSWRCTSAPGCPRSS